MYANHKYIVCYKFFISILNIAWSLRYLYWDGQIKNGYEVGIKKKNSWLSGNGCKYSHLICKFLYTLYKTEASNFWKLEFWITSKTYQPCNFVLNFYLIPEDSSINVSCLIYIIWNPSNTSFIFWIIKKWVLRYAKRPKLLVYHLYVEISW